MSNRRQIRELALQALYQYDARGEQDAEDIERSILDAPHQLKTKQQALEIAHNAWSCRADADAYAAELSPDWPTHRQPVVDRNLIRLAYYEMASGMTPSAVAINEAVELAKVFGSDRSPAFINAVLDKIARKLTEAPAKSPPAPRQVAEDQWLADALNDPPE